MKRIGRVEPKIVMTDEGAELLENEYFEGSIVMLTRKEMSTLIMLQDAWDGKVFRWPPRRNEEPDDRNMNDAFKSILSFVEAKFAINELKDEVEKLESILKG